MPSSPVTTSPTTDAYVAYLLVTMGLEPRHTVIELGRADPNPFLHAWLAEGGYSLGGHDGGVVCDFVVRYFASTDAPTDASGLAGISYRRSLVEIGAGDWDETETASDGRPIIAPPAGISVRVQVPEDGARASDQAAAKTVDERNRAEIEFFKNYENVHDLPEIYHLWSNRYVLPKLVACGASSIDDLLLEPMVAQLVGEPAEIHELASLGAGNCDTEVRLAEQLIARGVNNFHFDCLELNPHMLERGRELAAEKGLSARFSFTELDVEHWIPARPLSICLASHSLHHFEPLETLFDTVRAALIPGGAFVVNDMIGRNGHMRWPEALDLLSPIWTEMPERYKYNHLLHRVEQQYENWDCSTEGNEGIRAQDILPLLMERFEFEVFVAFSNLIDIFVDRAFGHNFDPKCTEDQEFILRLAELDEKAIDEGAIKPTHLLAVMRTAPVESPRIYRDWTPEFCVRDPKSRPVSRGPRPSTPA